MHSDLTKQNIARRLRELPEEIPAPYDWAEFRHRRRVLLRESPAAVRYRLVAGIMVVAAVLGAAALLRSRESRSSRGAIGQGAHAVLARSEGPAAGGRRAPGTRAAFEPGEPLPYGTEAATGARAQAVARWLADLPPQPVVVRVGTQAAVSGLEDQIAELDDLMSAARVAGTRPVRLSGLERERTELVRSLAQVRYAEILADQASMGGAPGAR